MNVEYLKYKEYMSIGSNTVVNHRIYKFPNGYGASVIEGKGSHGLELAPIQFIDDTYEIICEPLGYLNRSELEKFLDEIFKNGGNVDFDFIE